MSFVCKYVLASIPPGKTPLEQWHVEQWHVGWDEWVAEGEYKFTVVAILGIPTEAAMLCNYLNGGPHNPGVDTFHPAQLLGKGVE